MGWVQLERNVRGVLRLLVEVSSGVGGGLSDELVVPGSGVDDHIIGDNFGLVDQTAPVERCSSGEGAEEQGSKNGRDFHSGVCLLGVCLLGSDVEMLASKGVVLEVASVGEWQRVNGPAHSSMGIVEASRRLACLCHVGYSAEWQCQAQRTP
jgi:hypothetical protein